MDLMDFRFITVASLVFLCLPSVIAQATATVTISVPPSAPPNSRQLDPALVSLSLEQDRWPDWAATNAPSYDRPNTFFLNALDNLKQRSGAVPWLRIGANSADHTNFNPNVEISQLEFPDPTVINPYPEATTIIIGDGYYRLARFLPPGTHVIWGLNFGQNNLTAAFLEAKSLNKAFTSDEVKNAGVTLDFVEIGNEPDFYGNRSARDPATWTVEEYVDEWTVFARNVSQVLNIGKPNGPKLLGASFAFSSHNASTFSPQGAITAGLLDSDTGREITTISQHHYSGGVFCTECDGILRGLMAKSTIRGNLTTFIPDIAATHARGLDFVFGEANSLALHGAARVSNTAGAALWLLDHALYAATLGAKRVYYHDGIGYKYNLIQPVTLNRSTIDGSPLSSPLVPHVQPLYYAALITTELAGNSSQTYISELEIDDPQLVGYATFESSSGAVVKVVLIDSDAFLTSDEASGAKRPNKVVRLMSPGPQVATVKRLVIVHADDTSNLTWAGQSFETPDARPEGDVIQETVRLEDGIIVNSSEAVLITFE